MSTATKAKPKIKIHPLEDRVVILPDDEAETLRGGLYIPDTAKEKPTQGEVLAHYHHPFANEQLPHARGRSTRSSAAKDRIERMTGHAHDWPGHVVDHVIPLAYGGSIVPPTLKRRRPRIGRSREGVHDGERCRCGCAGFSYVR
jgi:Chaperonin 10 Kd subunit